MSYLFFDLETTGLPDFKKDILDPAQPHICQIAMVLTDNNGKIMGQVETLITPEGWTLSEELTKIHGVTTKECEDHGVQIKTALGLFRKFSTMASIKIAHNYKFDGFILKSVAARSGIEELPRIERFCTMQAMTPVMNLSPTEKMIAAGFNKPKPPNLTESYKYCMGKPFEGSHRALNDTLATKDIFFWLLRNERFEPQPRKEAEND